MSAPEITRGARHSRRSRRLNYLIAGITWTCGAAALLFAIWGWLTGHADAVSVLNTTFVVIATALGGLLALSGDGDVVLFTGTDEGQRDAIYKAAAHAFGVAIWGMFALWMACPRLARRRVSPRRRLTGADQRRLPGWLHLATSPLSAPSPRGSPPRARIAAPR